MSLKTSVESRESPLVLLTIAKFYYMEDWWLFHLHGRDGVGEGGRVWCLLTEKRSTEGGYL